MHCNYGQEASMLCLKAMQACQSRTCAVTCMAFLSCQGSWPMKSSHRMTPKLYTSLFSL